MNNLKLDAHHINLLICLTHDFLISPKSYIIHENAKQLKHAMSECKISVSNLQNDSPVMKTKLLFM